LDVEREQLQAMSLSMHLSQFISQLLKWRFAASCGIQVLTVIDQARGAEEHCIDPLQLFQLGRWGVEDRFLAEPIA
jgi:hypothetical protein